MLISDVDKDERQNTENLDEITKIRIKVMEDIGVVDSNGEGDGQSGRSCSEKRERRRGGRLMRKSLHFNNERLTQRGLELNPAVAFTTYWNAINGQKFVSASKILTPLMITTALFQWRITHFTVRS